MNTQEKFKIALVGNGHFGQAFTKRLAETNFEADLLTTSGRGQNIDLVEKADLVVLAVRPLQLADVVREIRGHLKGCVLSFTAATPQSALEESLDHAVVRAMTDIEFEQVLTQPNDDARGLLIALSQNPLIEVADEEMVDAHTIFVGCLPDVIAWQLLKNPAGAVAWLQNYFIFIQEKLGISDTVLQKLLFQGLMEKNLAGTVKRVATPGGITESLIQQLEQKSDSTLEELYAAGLARTAQVREAVAKSLKRN